MTSVPRRTSAPPNVIVILVSSLRADCLGLEDRDDPSAPLLAVLGARGARLTAVTAAAPSTLASAASLLTGELPDQHRIDEGPRPPALAEGMTTYAEALVRGHGYEALAVTEFDAPKGGTSIFQGFPEVHTGLGLGQARAAIRAWNRARDEHAPFFVFLQSSQPSAPYEHDAGEDALSTLR